MKIGFDAKRAFHNLAGLGNYSRQLINSVANAFPSNEYYLFTPSVSPHFYSEPHHSNIHIAKPSPITQLFFSKAWRAKGIIHDLKRNRIDLFHGLSNELPIGISKTGIKSVVTIHDLIFKRHPHYYFAWDRRIYEAKSRRACEEATHIIAISAQTKNDLVEFFHVPQEKISVIYPIINPEFFQPVIKDAIDRERNSLHLPHQFVLYVGTIEERKNLLGLVMAMNKLKDRKDLHLVVVGKPLMYKKRVTEYINQQKLAHKIHFYERISNVQLPQLYKSAEVVVCPSFYEGFGLPIAEAQASQTPVIASDISVFREAGGDAALYVDPNDETALAEAIDLVINNSMKRKEMISKGEQHASQFRGEIQAKRLMELYNAIIMNIAPTMSGSA